MRRGTLREAWRRLLASVRGRALDDDLDEELRSHVALAADEHERRGVLPDEARRLALVQLGGVTAARERHRDARAWPWLETTWADMRYALRGLWRTPAFTLVVIAMLAVGIGANTAIFSIVNAVVLRPVPFADPERLVWLEPDTTRDGMSARTYPVRVYEEMSRHTTSFEDMTGYFAFFGYASYTLTSHGDAARLVGVPVGPRFFDVLGVHPAIGRTFTKEELTLNGPRAALLTHATWRRMFAADPAIVGQVITISEEPFTVAGVMPEDFDFASVFLPGTRVDMFVPLALDEIRNAGNTLSVVGRLKPGVSIETARAEFASLMPRLNADNPDFGNRSARLVPLSTRVNGRVVRSLSVLWGAVGLVLLIVCANLSGLMLARTSGRAKEIAVRLAIGAGRARVVRQFLTESAVLSIVGAVLGVPLAYWIVGAVKSSATLSVPLLYRAEVDATALAFTMAVAMSASLLFGILPALRVANGDPQRALRDQARGSTQGRGHVRVRAALVVGQIALASVLLVGAGLLLRSFLEVQARDLGFAPSHATALRVNVSSRLTDDERRVLYGEITRRVGALPGVEALGLTDALPLDQNRTWGIGIPGVEFPPGDAPFPYVYLTGPGYLDAMGIPVRAGRDFDERDQPDAQPVIVLSESLARKAWPGLDAVGRTVRAGGNRERVVIGVVADVRQTSLETGDEYQMYLPVTQVREPSPNLVVRSSLPSASVAAAVRIAVRDLDPTLSITDIRPMETFVERAISPRRFLVLLLGGFSIVALTLACLGIYSTVAYGVGERVKEFGVRMALGATAGDIRHGVVRQTLIIAALGVAIGAIASLALTRLMTALLFGTSATDVTTFVATAALLVLVALVAGYLPAVRASRVSPMEALRDG